MVSVISWPTLGSFFAYFGAALVAEILFVMIYMKVTPHHEGALIHKGNVAAAISLAGAVLGFTIPLASVIIHSVSFLDMAVWSGVALVVQLAVFWLVDFALRGIGRHIEDGNLAAGITLGVAALAIGVVNAASMSY